MQTHNVINGGVHTHTHYAMITRGVIVIEMKEINEEEVKQLRRVLERGLVWDTMKEGERY